MTSRPSSSQPLRPQLLCSSPHSWSQSHLTPCCYSSMLGIPSSNSLLWSYPNWNIFPSTPAWLTPCPYIKPLLSLPQQAHLIHRFNPATCVLSITPHPLPLLYNLSEHQHTVPFTYFPVLYVYIFLSWNVISTWPRNIACFVLKCIPSAVCDTQVFNKYLLNE